MSQPSTSTPLPGAGVPLKLDRERTLRLDFNAFCALKKATGENPFKGAFWSDMGDPMRVRVTLWAALLHEDKTLTEEQVGDMIPVARLGEIVVAIGEAVSAAMPDVKPAA